ncbi:MAG: hypothetical protein H6858_08170 [Rhodospirillales bacterium]|nr:hypothetical protein [Alphaproteobacteria bacterium]MCB1841041.1 hypothetical protein [Alphaproteobacteria bacterium]MCB9977555.1 hypothetical protein [Rhodospirillales bacterium]
MTAETTHSASSAPPQPKRRRFFSTGLKKILLIFLMFSILTGSTLTMKSREAEGLCIPCWLCGPVDCIVVPIIAKIIQLIFKAIIKQNIHDHINSEINWIVEDFFEDFWVKGLAEMTEFLSAMGMYQMEILGAMLDAKHQLETQRLFWQLHAEAHKDYHPSEEICWMGTAARSLAASEARGLFNKRVMADYELDRQLGNANMNGAQSVQRDKAVRWMQFVTTYCDPKDNDWTGPGTGLDLACDHDGPGGAGTTGATNPNRKNIDIDYGRLIDQKRTLEVNFEGPTVIPPPDDEEDVLAMSSNLYGTSVLSRNISRQKLRSRFGQKLYIDLRSVAAKRSVAQNTFNSIVGMKSAGTSDTSLISGGPPLTRTFLAAAFKQLMPAGTPDSEIYAIIGENPSFYAQLEVLAKKIYQNPDFYSGLYDKPANVARKSVAMKAIDLMLDRILYESELRQEMLLSVLLSSYSRDDFRKLNNEIINTQKARD